MATDRTDRTYRLPIDDLHHLHRSEWTQDCEWVRERDVTDVDGNVRIQRREGRSGDHEQAEHLRYLAETAVHGTTFRYDRSCEDRRFGR